MLHRVALVITEVPDENSSGRSSLVKNNVFWDITPFDFVGIDVSEEPTSPSSE
jgi:hypothetical protein